MKMHTGIADNESSFKIYYDLMAKKVSEILLVSSPYDAFIMEEEGRLAQRIIEEYRGLNLSRPPRLTWVSTTRDALDALDDKNFDFVITMPRFDETDADVFGREIKVTFPEMPVFLLTHNSASLLVHHRYSDRGIFDRTLVWSGNVDLLLALIKNVEDRWNIAADTQRARVRVIILVEDSPFYRSSFLPLLYKEIVGQTQAVLGESLNEEHRLLKMRARPKLLVAENYEDAMALYRRYRPYLLTILSDVRFPREGSLCADAGFGLLSQVKADQPDLPLLMLSSEEINREHALQIPAKFVNKNNPVLHTEIREFFKNYLGFGDFVFRMPDGTEVARVPNLRAMEAILPSVPDESIRYHAQHNHFSTWLMARTEIPLAAALRPKRVSDFSSISEMKSDLISSLREQRHRRQQGVVTEFDMARFDPDADFIRIGKGSLGGKARGLAFFSAILPEAEELHEKFKPVDIFVPKSLVLATDAFDAFIAVNDLAQLPYSELTDNEITTAFQAARCPRWIRHALEKYLSTATYPLAVRSSSLLEDAMFQPFAGIYHTCMLPNNQTQIAQRLQMLIQAVKRVYASTYMEISRSYARSTLHRIEEEKMAVVVQQLIGETRDQLFYPTISGVGQSHNYYPIAHLKSEDGIAHIAVGMGKTVVEGEKALRFCPRYPEFLPQFSTVDDILENAQRFFYALKMNANPGEATDNDTLIRIDIDDAAHHEAVVGMASYYDPRENRIRDSTRPGSYPIITFAQVLKHRLFPLAQIITEILNLGRWGLGSPVELEFAVNLPADKAIRPQFAILQVRPMALDSVREEVHIRRHQRDGALLYSDKVLGTSKIHTIADIVYVNPETFDPARSVEMVGEIRAINGALVREGHAYLLMGPGRWGSADRWLGIPVSWNDISGVEVIVETADDKMRADPSQGSHFFHNITSLGISYITLGTEETRCLDWQWLAAQPAVAQSAHIRHVHLDQALILKIDGNNSRALLEHPAP